MEKLKKCFRDPIPEIYEAAEYLKLALEAHIEGDFIRTEALVEKADNPIIRQWTESIWGAKSPFVNFKEIVNPLPRLKKHERVETRMPDGKLKAKMLKRDGFNCVFCGIPLIRAEVRKEINGLYPIALEWGRKNIEQHSAFQAMWLQYDHLVPHSRGGNNDLENLVITCAPCNFGRMEYTIDEVGLIDPMSRERVKSEWTGLEEILN
jgi:5-methylcytosine-specific restriction endonuclease McrA